MSFVNAKPAEASESFQYPEVIIPQPAEAPESFHSAKAVEEHQNPQPTEALESFQSPRAVRPFGSFSVGSLAAIQTLDGHSYVFYLGGNNEIFYTHGLQDSTWAEGTAVTVGSKAIGAVQQPIAATLFSNAYAALYFIDSGYILRELGFRLDTREFYWGALGEQNWRVTRDTGVAALGYLDRAQDLEKPSNKSLVRIYFIYDKQPNELSVATNPTNTTTGWVKRGVTD